MKTIYTALFILLLASCNQDASVQSTASPSSSQSGAGTSASAVQIIQNTVAKGLDTLWAIDFAKDGRIFVSERPGRIRVIKDGALQATPWITLDVKEVSEAGLLGIALDPDFTNNSYIYAAYTFQSGSGDLVNRLVRLKEDKTTQKGSLDKILIDNVPGSNNHNGGRVKFGPDGKLYWSMGEIFERSRAQDLDSLNGKILRLNSDGTIPADNPFPNSYIYSYGHRNVQGLAWQPGTGILFATEHGPSGELGCCRDELNLVEKGKNYGWPEITGDQTKADMVTPILNSGATNTWAPGGMTFVTRGKWAGSLLFTGLRGRALYRVELDGKEKGKVSSHSTYLENEIGRIRDVAEGPNGNLYILTSNKDGRGNPGPDDDRLISLEIK